jgi:hypothetical protein
MCFSLLIGSGASCLLFFLLFWMPVGVPECCVFYVFSGGYNIKTGPGCSIEFMKFDMGGSAAVLGAAKAIGQVKPHGVEVSCLSCPCSHNHC